MYTSIKEMIESRKTTMTVCDVIVIY